jgi:hypothetical protein
MVRASSYYMDSLSSQLEYQMISFRVELLGDLARSKTWAAYPEDRPDDKPAPHPERKKAWEKAMKEDPVWKAFVSKKRAEIKTSKENQANSVFQGGELVPVLALALALALVLALVFALVLVLALMLALA